MKSCMKEMEVFEAFDGSIFLDEDDCATYEERLAVYDYLADNRGLKDWIRTNFQYVEDVIKHEWKP